MILVNWTLGDVIIQKSKNKKCFLKFIDLCYAEWSLILLKNENITNFLHKTTYIIVKIQELP